MSEGFPKLSFKPKTLLDQKILNPFFQNPKPFFILGQNIFRTTNNFLIQKFCLIPKILRAQNFVRSYQIFLGSPTHHCLSGYMVKLALLSNWNHFWKVSSVSLVGVFFRVSVRRLFVVCQKVLGQVQNQVQIRSKIFVD